jgi:transcriptional regulator with XRE-family HTH domain
VPRPTSASRPATDPHGDVRDAQRRRQARSRARDAVGSTLRALREAAGFTQEKLGERAGLHRTYVGGYERAERRLSIEAVEQILTALGVSWATFGAEMDGQLRRTRRGARRPETDRASS